MARVPYMTRFQIQRERESYRYWRGLSLARLALELTQGNRTLQLGGNAVHFADTHSYAFYTARDIAGGGRVTQTQPGDCIAIEQALGVKFDYKTPHSALVVAYNHPSPYPLPSDRGLCHGVKLNGLLTDLDRHSQEFIEDYFKMKIAASLPKRI